MSAPQITARRIGNEQQPIAIVDGFHPDPEALREAARAASFGAARRHYPGIRAELPADYFAQVRPALTAVLSEVFGAPRKIDLLDASFSIVTAPPDTLTVEQRLPHIDAVAPGRIALVQYLSRDDGDGTAFFRHRATGYETIDQARAADYLARLDADLRGKLPPAAYVNGDTPLFAEIGRVEARYNRAILYRSAQLHSGAISPDARLDANPMTGRLTVTAFLATA